MGRFDKGVSFYTDATFTVHFPEDDLACKYCPLMGIEMASGRRYCKGTGELLLSEDTTGFNCPLHFTEREDGIHEEMEE